MSKKRLIILQESEIEDLYGLPTFTQGQRSWHFFLNSQEWQTLEFLKTIGTKVHFILQLGYFKAKSMFFNFNFREIKEDFGYVMQQYFPKQKFAGKMISKKAVLANRRKILELLNYKLYKEEMRGKLEKKVSEIVTKSVAPDFVIRELLLYLENHRITIPAYSTIQKIISAAFVNEQNRINKLIDKNITTWVEQEINRLLSTTEALYEITATKKRPKEFTYSQMKQEIEKHLKNKNIYNFAKEILPKLKISRQNIGYYASLAEFYTATSLRTMEKGKVKLYLLCFIYHRFQQINDNLIACFIFYVDKYMKKAKEHAKERICEHKIICNDDLENAGTALGFYADKSIVGTSTFDKVRGKVFKIIEEEKIPLIKQYLSQAKFDKTEYEWEKYLQMAPKIIKNLRPIFLCIDFAGKPENPITKGIDFLKTVLLSEKIPESFCQTKIPKGVIPKHVLPYLIDSTNKLHTSTDKFEFFIYRRIRELLDCVEIFCSDTTQFKSLPDDLISDREWKNKDKIIKKLDIPKLKKPIKILLEELKEILETRLIEVNERIKDGQNRDIKITKGKKGNSVKWSLPYKKQEDDVNNPFYLRLPQANIVDVLRFADEKCKFIKAFTHIQPKYAKKRFDDLGIMACVIADGTSLGIYKMSSISSLQFEILRETERNFLRPQTLREANDILSLAISKLPIFKHWNIREEIIHASADGQKFQTKNRTLKARYSSKYFGLGKGVVAYTRGMATIRVKSCKFECIPSYIKATCVKHEWIDKPIQKAEFTRNTEC